MDEAAVGEQLHRRGWRTSFTVNEMVESWAQLITAVENGYDDEVDEYTNDLYCRTWLHEAWVLLDDDVLLRHSPRIEVLDARFRTATVDDDGYVLSQFHHVTDPTLWWWRRHPRILTGDFGQSLRQAGATG